MLVNENKQTLNRNLIFYAFLFLIVFFSYILLSLIESDFSSFYKPLALGIFLYCLYKGFHESSVVNPYFLFSVVPLSLIIYSSKISSTYLLELTSSTIFFALFNILFFLIGINITKIKLSNTKKQINNKNNLLLNTWLMFIFAIIPFFAPQFILSSVIKLFIYPAIASVLKSKNKLSIFLVYFVYIFLSINTLTKLEVLSLLLVTVISIVRYYSFHKHHKFIFISSIFFGVLLMLEMFDLKSYFDSGGTFMSYILGGYIDFNISSPFLESGSINWDLNDRLVIPYMYLTTPWTNLQHVMETQDTYTYGLWFFKPFLGWLQLDNLYIDNYNLEAYSSFNTFTYLSVIFKDFGYWFSVVISLFLGFFVKMVYNRFLISKSPLDVASYALIAVATFQMFFSNHFFMLSYPFTIIVLLAIYQFIFVRNDS